MAKSSKKAARGKAHALPPAGIDVVIGGVHVDLDAPDLPPGIAEAALSSGGYPYDALIKRGKYEAQLETLQIELLKLQAHVRATGMKLAVLFEGRDSAGKGGTIQRFMEHLNPRSARLVALTKPTGAERGQFYLQRYIAQLPTMGEIVFFDRSWYNRAVVEPVMGFCTPEETAQLLKDVPVFEKMIVENGVHLVKFWLTIGREMQVTRLFERRHDPLKHWKLSEVDYKGLPLWDEYTKAAETMLDVTHTKAAPWMVLRSNDQRRARLEAMRALLAGLDYEGKDKDAVGAPDTLIVADAGAYREAGGEI